MKRLSDDEIFEKADALVMNLVADSVSKRKEDCQYLSHSNDRYCRASTHKNCTTSCRFFSPSTRAKVKRLMLYIIDLQDDLKSQNETIDNLRKELAIQRERVRYLDEELALRDKQTELAVEMAKNVGGTDEV